MFLKMAYKAYNFIKQRIQGRHFQSNLWNYLEQLFHRTHLAAASVPKTDQKKQKDILRKDTQTFTNIFVQR